LSNNDMFPYYGDGRLFQELCQEVRCRLSPLTARMLSMTCKAERGRRGAPAEAGLLRELAREGRYEFLGGWDGPRFAAVMHDRLLHEAIEHRQWELVRMALADHEVRTRPCCVRQAIHQGLEDVASLHMMLLHSAGGWNAYVPVLITAALEVNKLALLKGLVGSPMLHHKRPSRDLCHWIDRIDLDCEVLLAPDFAPQPRLEWLARVPLLEWLQARFPDEDIVHGRVWLALMRDMVAQHWTPEAIESFCRAGLGNGRSTPYAAFCVSPRQGSFRETGVPEYLERWAREYKNQPVLEWAQELMA